VRFLSLLLLLLSFGIWTRKALWNNAGKYLKPIPSKIIYYTLFGKEKAHSRLIMVAMTNCIPLL